MTPYQKTTLERIEAMKAVLRAGGPYTFTSGKACSEKQYRASMAELARSMVRQDDRERECRQQINQPSDAIGRSRSCAFGRFESDDES